MEISPSIEYKDGKVNLLKGYGLKEIKRHARVSLVNKCHCNDCFCCACLAWMKENHVSF